MRSLLASFVAAIAMFFTGFIWWGLLMPVVRPARVIESDALLASMNAELKDADVYFYPNYAEPADENSGPTAILHYLPGSPSMATTMGLGFLHMFGTAFLASCLLGFVALPSFSQRFVLVASLGLLVAFWADLGNMIWWWHPPMWTAFHFGYDLLSWIVAGAIIASIVKPQPESIG